MIQLDKTMLTILTHIIGGVESGGQTYGKRNYAAYAPKGKNSGKEKTCTLGWAQNYGNEGRNLCRMILQKDAIAFRKADTASIEKKLDVNWESTGWNPSEAEKKALIAIITTDVGKECQDILFETLVSGYVKQAEEFGVTSVKAQMMWCEIQHLGGLGPVKRIFTRAKKPYTPETIFASLLLDQKDATNDNQVGDKKFQTRHECCVKWVNKYVADETNPTGGKEMSKSRQAVVNLVKSWKGRNESDGSHKYIIDIYNSHTGSLPRGIKMEYKWAWCAATWSALAVKLLYTSIMPIEISCGYLIEAARKMKCWIENDAYMAQPGDAILYDWDDTGKGDNTGWPEHVGTVIETHKDAGYYVVMEGNYGDAVKPRTISINGRYLRGFITPKYDNDYVSEPPKTGGKDSKTVAMEVIAGTWGSGDQRKKALTDAGYNYSEIQKLVNQILNGGAVVETTQNNVATVTKKVTSTCAARKFDRSLAGTYMTTANLYCRNDAGTNKKALCLIPKGTKVQNYGYYNLFGSVKWLYIQFVLNGTQYTGFSSKNFLKK